MVFYIHSMLFNSRSAVASIKHVRAIFEAISEGTAGPKGGEKEMDEILNALQNLVVNGAALSRFLWPSRKEHEWRGSQIRRALKIEDTNPLRSRHLRNDIEHMDERIDKYLENGFVGDMQPQYVGVTESHEVPSHYFRAYFVDTGMFQMLENRYEVPPLAEEIIELHEKLLSCDKNGERLR
jgi:putative component of toxin-antitoxin plasmid stabilization module